MCFRLSADSFIAMVTCYLVVGETSILKTVILVEQSKEFPDPFFGLQKAAQMLIQTTKLRVAARSSQQLSSAADTSVPRGRAFGLRWVRGLMVLAVLCEHVREMMRRGSTRCCFSWAASGMTGRDAQEKISVTHDTNRRRQTNDQLHSCCHIPLAKEIQCEQ